jgi:hypothetical protein
MSNTAKVDAVQARFIREIEDRGMGHVLEWINSWYAEFASARLDDEIERVLGKHRTNREGLTLFLTRKLTHEAPTANRHSSQPGANMMQQAIVAEAGQRLHNVAALKQDTDWSAFCTQVREKDQA